MIPRDRVNFNRLLTTIIYINSLDDMACLPVGLYKKSSELLLNFQSLSKILFLFLIKEIANNKKTHKMSENNSFDTFDQINTNE